MKKNLTLKKNEIVESKDPLKFKDDKEEIALLSHIVNLDYVESIKSALLARNITSTELAGKLGVSKSYVSQIFNGNRMLNINFITRIRRKCNISLELVDTARYLSSVTFVVYNSPNFDTATIEKQITENYIDISDINTVTNTISLTKLIHNNDKS